MRQDNAATEKAQQALRAKLATVEAEKAELAKEKAEAEERGKTLFVEVEKCHAFMLCISEECFHQGLRQTTFFHGIPTEDSCYDLDKDVVDGKLVPIGGNADATMEEVEGRETNDYGDLLILCLYVDDVIFTGSNLKMIGVPTNPRTSLTASNDDGAT